MRRRHFQAFAPHCPVCAKSGRDAAPLILADVVEERGEDVRQGMLHCPHADCRHEYPVIDGIPVIVPDLATMLAERGLDLMLRDDFAESLEGMLGDAIGPVSWFDGLRQTLSTYGWDGWADLDPGEADEAGPRPGAVRACLAELHRLATPAPAARVLDLGCGAGRTSFDLAALHPQALVLGLDLHLGLLRLAQGALGGEVSYPRRRIGIVYDRRRFAVSPEGGERVDFWACDAAALPFAPASVGLIAALNLLDCVPAPRDLLAALAEALQPAGDLLVATPYDWSTRATPLGTWIGGHSQRAPHRGDAEPALLDLIAGGTHPRAVHSLRLCAEQRDWPWQTRLHARASVAYRTHLMAMRRIPF